jgi:hypothetical protein
LFALAQARRRRLKRPAMRIKWLSSRSLSEPYSSRHHTRRPRPDWPMEK